MQMEIGQGVQPKKTYIANESYPNNSPDYGLNTFFYQTLDWLWNSEDRALKRGNNPSYYVSSRNPAMSTVELSLDDDDVPRHSLEDKLEYKEPNTSNTCFR